MAASAANMQKHYAEHGHHSTGKTKENDEGVRQKAKKISEALQKHFETHDGWSLGMTKETSNVIAKRSKKISGALKGRIFTDAHIENLRKTHLLTHEEVQSRLMVKNLQLTVPYIDTIVKSELRCLACGYKFTRSIGAIFNNDARCPTCFPPWADKTSKWQKEVFEFVKTLTDDAVLDDRMVLNGKELDVYVPSKNFAIECNGLYWHSEAAGRFGADHVEKKRLLARDACIAVLFLFEDEWRDKKPIIESMIKHRLGLSQRIAARKLRLERCSTKEVSLLIDEWHLEGHVNSSYALKLTTQDGKTMGACSLRWARGTDRKVLEVARIAFMPGVHVQGGISRFIKESMRLARENGATQLLSYSDNRLGTGQGYSMAGMKLDGITIARFWWTDFNNRYDRFKYRADKSKGLTERQVATEAHVHRVYGCSNSRWVADL